MRCFSPTWKPHFIMVILLRKSTNYQRNIESNIFRMKSPVLFVFIFEKKRNPWIPQDVALNSKRIDEKVIFFCGWQNDTSVQNLQGYVEKTHRRAVKLWNNILFLCFGGFGFWSFFSLISNISPSQRDRARACVCNEM